MGKDIRLEQLKSGSHLSEINLVTQRFQYLKWIYTCDFVNLNFCFRTIVTCKMLKD